MMPQLVTVKVRRPDARPLRVWVPLLPLALILSPVLLLVALAVVVASLVFRVNPLRALGTGWQLVSALRGTRFDLEHGRTAVLVDVR